MTEIVILLISSTVLAIWLLSLRRKSQNCSSVLRRR